MIWLYAVTDRPEAPLPPVRGIEAEELSAIACDAIAAVVSRCARQPMPPTEANVLTHEAVLECLMSDRTVLPARFGCVASDERCARDALVDRYTWCLEALRRLRGRVELGVRILWDPGTEEGQASTRRPQPPGGRPDGSPPGSGRAYLLARLDEERQWEAQRSRAQALASAVHEPLAELAAESSYRLLVTPRMVLAGAYLVECSRVDDFRRRAQDLAFSRPDLDLLCTGPWPPYSFVTDRPWETVKGTISHAGH
ncbi:MAG: GvpL/GvpF family gas vesicle protein [Armatimonadetes bacterium]|nr:GvpL/GvpF family gas vesicle protein [Armatimonadota bacterium]